MSQFSFRGSPSLQCPVTASSSLAGGSSPAPGAIISSSAVSHLSSSILPPSSNHPLSVRMAVTSAVIRPPGSPASSVSPAQSHGPPPPPTSVGPPGSAGRCCDTGRPIFTDPITGQTVCSCQYELLGSYQRLGGLPAAALSMYSAPYAAAAAAASEGMAYFPGLGAEQAPFYTPTAAGLDLKENLGAGAAGWPYPSVYHPYDAAFSYPFNGYGMDLNGARRKNATRETTSTLKAWLNEHKKNPYPTKGEKIMLAIITKMTLTQVSTWFANARRRLKKENKMTWEPRNRVEDEDNNNEDDDSGRKSVDDKDRLDSKDSGTGSSEDGDRGSSSHRLDLIHGGGPGGPGGPGRPESEWSESRADSGPDSPECLFDPREPRHPLHLQHPAYLASAHSRLLRHSSPDAISPLSHHHIPSSTSTSTSGSVVKPRIWSLADMASKDHSSVESQSPQHQSPGNAPPGGPYPPSSGAGGNGGRDGGGGKIVSPLASRLHPHHPLHSAMHPGSHQFHAMRHHPDFYRNFYGAPHLSGGDVSLLETYSRTLGGLGSVMATSGAGNHPGLLPTSVASTTSGNGSSKQPPYSVNGSQTPAGAQTPTGVLLQGGAGGGHSPSPTSSASSQASDRSPNHSELKSPGRV